MSPRNPLRCLITRFALLLLTLQGAGCAYVAAAKEAGDPLRGVTYYVGGAGPIGHVGSWDVPRGLADAGYPGLIEVHAWQGVMTVDDQIQLARNREKAVALAARIKQYRCQYPDEPISIIALSAGTGIATFALEYLPEGVRIDRVIFLACSLSSKYDMTRLLRRVRGGLYVIHSPYDRILRNVVWYTGTVDRSPAAEGVAGLEGFRLPPRIASDTEIQYRKLHNVPYRAAFGEAGYGGGHTDCTGRTFVRDYLAPVLAGDDQRLLGGRGDRNEAAEAGPGVTADDKATSRASSRPGETESSKAAP